MAINRDFPVLCAFSANFVRDKIEEREILHPMVKSAACFGAPEPSYGHFSHLAGHGRGKFSSQKTPKMAINCDFPGLCAYSANFAKDKVEEREITHSMVKSAACFGALEPSHGHFSHPAGHGPGKFSSRKTPKMAINRDFLGLRALWANFLKDKIKERKIPDLMVKSAACFGAPNPSYGHFSHPAGHGRGNFSSRNAPKMAINRDLLGLRAF